MTTLKVYTDASSRYRAILVEAQGEDRLKCVYPSSIGAVIKDGNKVVGSISEKIGIADSNYAEFVAMLTTCRYLIAKRIKKVDFYSDSLNLVMMVNQGIISGMPDLRKLSYAILGCLRYFDSYTMSWIDRVYNKEAHEMARKAFKVG